jgi:UDP-N-acetylmuramate dehydrogenase
VVESTEAVQQAAGGELDAPLGARTTYRVGGPAALLVTITSADQLTDLGAAVRHEGIPVLAVGQGSNLLVSDAGFSGVAITFAGDLEELAVDEGTVRAGAAVRLPVLARRTAAAGWRGLEWNVGVPGSVGGGVRMNAGGHGRDTAASLVRVRLHDLATGQDEVVDAAALELGYRRSNVAAHHVVVWAEHHVSPGEVEAGEQVISEIVQWRRDNQPGGSNAGSVFTNPVDDSAGRLIDSVGLKGFRVGTAEVSTKHANFIQADAGGSADHVLELMEELQRRVEAATRVRLVPETVLVGFEPDRVAAIKDARG